MIDAPLAYAFGVGMVATFNPCGFAMLPAYLSYFLGLEGSTHPDERASVLRALAVGLSVTVGFLVVFGIIGVAEGQPRHHPAALRGSRSCSVWG
jgi:cytochrome c biogenesis protein CcdA